MQEDGKKDAQSQNAAVRVGTPRHHGAGQCNAIGKRVQRHSDHGRRPRKLHVLAFKRLFMVMGTKEPLDQK